MKTKTCFKCLTEKPASEFYRHKRMTDGLLGKCKDCTKADVIKNRNAKLDYYREYDRERFANDPKRRDAAYKYAAKIRDKYPQRTVARSAVHNAVRDGRMTRGPCAVCGSKIVEGHHEDYSKPLEVIWLCTEHHNAWHHHRKEIEETLKRKT